jgi:dihydrofolate synthase/folylpolyglutamate synthase
VNFAASLDYLYGLQRFGVKLGLENMRALKTRMPLLQVFLPCVHISGTNGKGSVSAFIAEILKHSRLKVGLYTSPHLHCFSERIRIDGEPIQHQKIASLAEIIQREAEGIPLTFFEATTAMALLAFNERQVDIAVIETGLGGRLDATNIVEPQLCLITPISMDHSEHLGDNLAKIAAEKAGIIKPGVPVVVGKQGSEAVEMILATAAARGAAVSLAGRDFSWQGDHNSLSVDTESGSLSGLACSLAGSHQLDNFAQAVAAVMQLRKQGFTIPDAAIYAAGRTTVWAGRLEWWGESRDILLDVSHNLAGISCLADYLDAQGVSSIQLVTGLSGERCPSEVLMPLVKLAAAVYAVPVSYDHFVSTAQIAGWAQRQNLMVTEYDSASAGFVDALRSSRDKEPVIVCGSLYLVAEIRQRLLEGSLAVKHER